MDAAALNSRLSAQLASIQTFITEQITAGDSFSFEELERFLTRQKPKPSFLDFIEKRIAERGDIKAHTKATHYGMVKALREFGHIVTFDDITKKNISAFDDWLHKKTIMQTTVFGYHKRLKSYINETIRFDLLQANPYAQLKIDRGKHEGIKYLRKEELDRIEHCALPDGGHLERTSDLFVFQCYTGLSYVDLMAFDWKSVQLDGDDYIISDTRKKTDENYYIVLLKPTLRVLEKYGFDLPRLSNQKYNDYLKVVAAMASVDKPVTTHWARHTLPL